MRFIICLVRDIIDVDSIVSYEVIKDFDDLSLLSVNRFISKGGITKFLGNNFIYGDLLMNITSHDMSRLVDNGHTTLTNTSKGYLVLLDCYHILNIEFKRLIRDDKIQSICK